MLESNRRFIESLKCISSILYHNYLDSEEYIKRLALGIDLSHSICIELDGVLRDLGILSIEYNNSVSDIMYVKVWLDAKIFNYEEKVILNKLQRYIVKNIDSLKYDLIRLSWEVVKE